MKDKLLWSWFGVGALLQYLQLSSFTSLSHYWVIFQTLLILGVCVILLRGKDVKQDIGAFDWYGIFAGLSILFALNTLYGLFDAETTNQQTLLGSIGNIGWIRFGLIVTLIAPLGEEILYRRFIIGKNVTIINMTISSLVFGLTHTFGGFTLSAFIIYTLSGLVFGWVYSRKTSLVSSITVHVLYNTIQLGLLLLDTMNW